MANIKVNELLHLSLTGSELFNDSESFLTELSDETEQMGVIGGACNCCWFTSWSKYCKTV
ncbi:hypothetical protein NIES2107_27310 [Nostoc carneum NIES-2107]|nr:hypothetical protein NIES2107_27310 [Nostoc carneum NIES-2107]